MAQRRKLKSKRGVVLLVVLSLLALFVLIGVTYAVVAGTYKRAALSGATHERREDDPRDYLDRTVYQLLRDTNQRNSALLGHSLLRDLYGNDGVLVQVDNPVTAVAGGQFVQFSFRLVSADAQPFGRRLIARDDYYNGSVITFLQGAAAGHSTRVVDFFYNRGPDGAWGTTGDDDGNMDPDNVGDGILNNAKRPGVDDVWWFRIERLESDLAGNVPIRAGDFFLINGRAFNGTGAGYTRGHPGNAATGMLADLGIGALGGLDNLSAPAWEPGPDRAWGVAGTDDDGINGVDDPGEAGWSGSDDRPNPVVLLPHYAGYDIPTRRPISEGGLDESWDAVDYHNVPLAMVPPNLTQVPVIIPSMHRPALVNFWNTSGSASFGVGNPSYRNFRRKVIMRPMPWDHPNFTGSNPLMAELNAVKSWNPGADMQPGHASVDDDGQNGVDDAGELGWPGTDDFLTTPASPTSDADFVSAVTGVQLFATYNGQQFYRWDVDNDGDGVPDSVWVDVGLPIRTSPDGRKYKPLVALLVQDMDGRLNVNANGNLVHLAAEHMASTTGNVQTIPSPARPTSEGPFAGGRPRRLGQMPRGEGIGPAETYLGHVFNPGTATAEYLRVLQGRYGADGGLPPAPGRTVALASPPPATAASSPFIDDTLSQVKSLGIPRFYAQQFSDYQNPPDLFGRGALGLNYFGSPHVFYKGQNPETYDDPYELDLSKDAPRGSDGIDTPYTPAELERLLRWDDVDAGTLPQRLLRQAFVSLNGTSPLARQRRGSLTTESWSIPQPTYAVPPELRSNNRFRGWNPGPDGRWGIRNVDDDGDGNIDNFSDAGAAGSDDVMHSANIVDLFAHRLRAAAVPDNQVNRELRKMIPFEILRGGKFNVNRRWGDGRDNNNNGIVDEPFEGDGVSNDGDGIVDEADEMEPNERDDDGDGIIDEADERSGRDREQMGTSTGTYFDGTQIFENNGDTAVPFLPGIGRPRSMGRQIFARHLYCLLMFLKQRDIDIDGDGMLTAVDRIGTADMLAQWAINVVDFRDPDSINTSFEYDRDPFDGWQVDGLLGTDENTTAPPPPFQAGDRAVVWGCEAPALLMTESLAFHDRRTEDLGASTIPMDPNGAVGRMSAGMVVGERDFQMMTGNRPHNDYDQRLRPRGSLFIELYNPWTSGNRRRPHELYRNGVDDDGDMVVDDGDEFHAIHADSGVELDLLSATGSPVWRILVVRGNSRSIDPDRLDRRTAAEQANFRSVNGVERQIYFADPSNVNDLPGSVKYYTNLNIARIRPGRYAVVGPRGQQGDLDMDNNPDFLTTIGRLTNDTDSGQGGSNLNYANTRQILLEPSTNPDVHQVKVLNNQNSPVEPTIADTPDDVQPVVAVVINQAIDGGGNPRTDLNLSLSEPVNGYPNVVDPDGMPASGDESTFDPMAADGEGAYAPLVDEPLDHQRALENDGSTPRTDNEGNNTDLMALLRNGTQENFRKLYLQRLANPTLAFDAVTNPYLTVDSLSSDLTAFNGVTNDDPPGNDNDDPDLARPGARNIHFAALQRGEHNLAANPSDTTAQIARRRNIWDREEPNVVADLNTTPTEASPVHHFPQVLKHSLGWLNEPYWPYYTGAAMTGNAPNLASTRVFVGAPDSDQQLPVDPTTGTQLSSFAPPFPWMVWYDRPLASPRELMYVPWKHQSRWLWNYGLATGAGRDHENYQNYHSRLVTGGASTLLEGTQLLNFFHGDAGGGEDPAMLNRLFDFVETPSRFVGTEKYYNTLAFSVGYHPGPDAQWGFAGYDDDLNGTVDDESEAGWPGSDDQDEFGPHAAGTNYGDAVRDFRPPFNYYPRFRDPGKININTFFGGDVWFGIAKGFPAMDNGTFATEVALSRQGFGTTPIPSMANPVPNDTYPTLFANPFRAEWSADLMPSVADMRKDGVGTNPAAIQATMARSRPSDPSRPLFSSSISGSGNEYRDTNRNPYFRYHGLNRLDNLVTTHSNVYAVWITVGFFEVEASPIGPNPAHPDGYMLGQEIGADSGQVKRHRGFYMIDRSIPVAFEPGENHNVDRCILLRRFIE